ncbi:MAG: two-component system sensor histidine kinase NtrB [Verrucomicrobiota bacterium]
MARMRIEDLEIADADIYRTVLYHFPDMVHSADGDGRIVYANRRMEEILQYSADKLLTMRVQDLYPDDVLASMSKGFEDLRETGDKRVESVFLSRTGQRIPVEMRSFSVYDDDGRFLHTFSISRDLRAIKRLQNDLIRAGRLAAIGELSSGIAHDINNPLQVISLSVQLQQSVLDELMENPDDSENQQLARQMNADIGRACDTIKKLATHLLDFSQKSFGAHVAVDLRTVLEEALFITQHRRKKAGVTLETDIGETPAIVNGSPNQLEQVFVNLISNACDAMEETEGDRVLHLTLHRDNHGEKNSPWICEVKDTGCGMPEDVRDRMFKSFFTTKNSGKRTGLGLSITRGIVQNHNGKIGVESEAGQGTAVTIQLPARANTEGGPRNEFAPSNG